MPTMEARLDFEILPQPTNTTCGPTCLHAVYKYFNDDISLQTVIEECQQLEEGGTLAVLLGCHALSRGYDARIFTFNLQVFDPTWFIPGAPPLADALRAQMAAKDSPKLHLASHAYLDFLELGGTIRMQDVTGRLLRKYLKKAVPVLTGLSATYLYQEAREIEDDCRPDSIIGLPSGHFVVLCGYHQKDRSVLVADPLHPNPLAQKPLYEIQLDRVICSILLGILTYDANLLVIEPRRPSRESPRQRT